jgi:hypothetical protein
MRPQMAVLAQLAALALLGTAAPETSHVRLEWEAPPPCPDHDAVIAAMTWFLGEHPREGDPLEVEAHGVVTRSEDGGWVLDLDTRTPHGEGHRSLHAQHCDVLADAAALILALSSDPMTTLERVRSVKSEVASEAPSDPPPIVRSDVSDPPQTEPPAKEPEPAPGGLRGGVSFLAAAGWGALPSVYPGVSLTVGLFGRLWWVEAGWLHWFVKRATAPDAPAVGGDFQLSVGVVRGCPVIPWRRLQIPICGGFDFGVLRADSAGLPDGRVDRRFWAAFIAGPGLAWEPTPVLAWRVNVEAVVPFDHPSFEIIGAGKIHEVAPAGVRGLVGLEVRFP